MVRQSALISGIVIALIIGAIGGYYVASASSVHVNASKLSMSAVGDAPDAVAFNGAMRKLWEDHITYTRLYIVEAASDSKGASDTAARLLTNQEDIGNAIKPYYGEAAGNQLTTLLKAHIQGAVDILNAAKAGDTTKQNASLQSWHDNADQIATFLSQANPENWPLDTMKAHMKEHLDLTLQEAVDQLDGEYASSIAYYDKVHTQILEMADILSSGIVKQFPDKF